VNKQEAEAIQSLIAYLEALTEVQKSGGVKVYTEIKRTIEKIENLLG
jgi:hypothetical protein